MKFSLDRKRFISLTLILLIIYLLLLSTVSVTYPLPKRQEYPKPLSFYETDFWNITKAKTDPLNLTFLSEENITYSDEQVTKKLTIRYLSFLSEYYGGREIIIQGLLIYPAEYDEPLPAIMLFHGYGGSKTSFYELMLYVAARGYVVFSIDAPGSGDSTNFPSNDPINIVNVTDGPEGAYYYHVVWSGLRGITVLTSLSFVNASKIAVAGASMGGLETFMIAAIDDRPALAVPIVASGNFVDLVKAGTFANVMIPPNITLEDSELLSKTEKYFDVYAYASKIKIPILLLESTNDEYFTIYGINDTFSVIPSEDKYINIAPNWDHFLEYKGWRDVVVLFADSVFEGGEGLPKISFNYSQSYYGIIDILHLEGHIDGNYNLSLVWRESVPGSTWKRVPMTKVNDKWVVDIAVTTPGKILFYLSAEKYEIQISTTNVFETKHTVFALPLLAIVLSLIQIIFVSKIPLRNIFSEIKLKLDLVGLFLWIGAVIGIMFPFMEIVGRATLSIWEFIDLYGYPLRIIPWASYLIIAFYTVMLLTFLKNRRIGLLFMFLITILLCSVIITLQILAESSIRVSWGIGTYILITVLTAGILKELYHTLKYKVNRM